MKQNDRLCERCRVQRAVRFELTVLGPLDLRETSLCIDCQAAIDGAIEPTEAEGSLAHLGPIDFDCLRASIHRAEVDPEADDAELRFVAQQLPSIAAAHAQTLPPDIQDFVVRHSA